MADDREVLREIWEGKVPISFQLASEDVNTLEQPEPIYLLVPRQTYFPLVTEKVQKHFQKYVNPDKQGEMWLDEEGQPLKWHYPVGVLFDLSGAEGRLPWSLTVHYTNFPEADILHCPHKDAVESHFMSMVKEADSLKHRSKIINSMQKRDHRQLWQGLLNDKFDQFWSVNRKLMEHTDEQLFKHIPFRIYQGDLPFTQKLIRPITESGSLVTLEQLLQETVFSKHENAKRPRVLIQGIETPLQTPLQWLSEHFSHPDNFLHISVLPV